MSDCHSFLDMCSKHRSKHNFLSKSGNGMHKLENCYLRSFGFVSMKPKGFERGSCWHEALSETVALAKRLRRWRVWLFRFALARSWQPKLESLKQVQFPSSVRQNEGATCPMRAGWERCFGDSDKKETAESPK